MELAANIESMVFGLSLEEKIVHIDEVENGLKCRCICPACHGNLIAKNKGELRGHHFAHHASIEGENCSETALHRAAKQLVADHKNIRLPSPGLWPDHFEPGCLQFTHVELERRMDIADLNEWIVADCLGSHDSGEVVIEIAVRHHVDEEKTNKLQHLNLPAMEIDISDWATVAWTWERLTDAVLNEAQRRHWLYLPEWFQAKYFSNQVVSTSPLPASSNEWIFSIGNTRVFVRALPYANVKVYHRPDHHARKIVEPLCRGRGYWNDRYKCWIVFDKFKYELLGSLASYCTGM